MVPDLVVVAGAFGAFALWCWGMGKLTARIRRRVDLESPPPDPVPVALRLVADHRERLSRAHMSTVRPRHGRMALSPVQRAAIDQGKRKK